MKQILTADIGGTHSRFAHFQLNNAGALNHCETVWLKTRKATSFPNLLEQLQETDFSLKSLDCHIAVLAAAGPVDDGSYCSITNVVWDIELEDIPSQFKIDRSLLINDFVAQAYACRSDAVREARTVLPGDIDPHAAIAVIGAGTGLGQCALIMGDSGKFIAVPSEGSHSSFPFESAREVSFMHFLKGSMYVPLIVVELVVSGSGLSRIHRFLTGDSLEAAAVAKKLTPESETLAWVARFFGRASRNYALQVLARGGVYITGGIAAKVPQIVTHKEFEKEFRTSAKMAHILEDIPVFLNSNEESALWGCAMLGKQLLGQ